MAQRSYETDSIRVNWNSDRCIHTGVCLRLLPGVFDTAQRPWVTVEGATADEIAHAIENCPSGALTYDRLDGQEAEVPIVPTEIVPRPHGPLAIKGSIVVKDAKGEVFTEATRATLCRCGNSQNQPFCDLSHLSAGFRDSPRAISPERTSAEAPSDVVANKDQEGDQS